MAPLPARLGDARFREPAAFFELRDAFEGWLGDRRWLTRRINERLACLTRDPTEGLDGYACADAWQLEDEAYGALQLTWVGADLAPLPWLSDEPFHRLMACLGAEPVELRWLRRGRGDPGVFDPDVGLVEGEVRTLSPGEVLAIPAREVVVEVLPVARPTAFLTLESRSLFDQIWFYDRDTLRPCFAVAAGGELARIDRCLQYLGHKAHAPAADALEGLCSHPTHFVRWSAFTALCAVDEARARAALGQLCDDPHPHVRRAARATLAQFGG
jgi:hypothetical protein